MFPHLYLLLFLLRYTSAFALPFLSSRAPTSLEEQDRWLSTPSKVTQRDFHPSVPASKVYGKGGEGRILILTPLKDASAHLPHHFALLLNLSYPHHLIDLGFIIGDSSDGTQSVLKAELDKLEKAKESKRFNSCTTVIKNLGDAASEEVSARHGFAAQVDRRKKIAIVRNTLLRKSLKPDHDWVYWRDVDVAESPTSILEDLVAHDKDVIVPNVWFRRKQKGRLLEGGYDYNSWQETSQSEAFKDRLDTEVIVFEGYSQFKTHRRHMAKIGDWRNSAAFEIPLDGVGGVSLLVRAEVHRKGLDFPIKPVDHQIETEGFAKLAKIAGYGVYGLPNYVVWHFDTSEKEGNLHETPAWLWPLVIFVTLFTIMLCLRYRKWILYKIPILRRLNGAGSTKVRQY